mmetsp:Transcript_34104/g.106170  ORF Transcript_34104/g.106170 Transcript_34104/m.106170 type:complete len:261 (+) Transcript_34104:1000-1782(+)
MLALSLLSCRLASRALAPRGSAASLQAAMAVQTLMTSGARPSRSISSRSCSADLQRPALLHALMAMLYEVTSGSGGGAAEARGPPRSSASASWPNSERLGSHYPARARLPGPQRGRLAQLAGAEAGHRPGDAAAWIQRSSKSPCRTPRTTPCRRGWQRCRSTTSRGSLRPASGARGADGRWSSTSGSPTLRAHLRGSTLGPPPNAMHSAASCAMEARPASSKPCCLGSPWPRQGPRKRGCSCTALPPPRRTFGCLGNSGT